MDFSNFPAQWEWLAIILAGVAILMAVQPLFQMIWGAPEIVVGFGETNIDHTEYFDCRIWNAPITSRILNFLRVRRDTAPEITASFTIEDRGSGRKVFRTSYLVEIKTQTNVVAERVPLPSSFFPASFAVVLVSKGDDQVRVYDKPIDEGGGLQVLPIGDYTVRVSLGIGGKERKIQQYLTVQKNYPFAYWDVNS